MTKKNRQLIEILLDNVKPEDWPENLPYAAQDKDCCALWFYDSYPKLEDGFDDRFSYKGYCKRFHYHPRELCEHWNKTILHRDEFMKRWNERNPAVDSEGWIKWNGGEMPVENGTLIDVKYRDCVVNLHVEAGGNFPSNGSVITMAANRWEHIGVDSDIIAYRLHAPQQQKTPQQLALEKFGTDWHDNEGVQPVDDNVLIDAIVDGVIDRDAKMYKYTWPALGLFKIKKWRIHSDEKESHIDDVAEEMNAGGYTDRGSIELACKPESGIEKVIADRGMNYGRFEDGAEIMQQLKLIAHTSQGWERMKPIQRESMDMILHKIGRILNGDPSYVDSWIDIEGYSKLVSDWLKGESK